jgi:hypothetical protein
MWNTYIVLTLFCDLPIYFILNPNSGFGVEITSHFPKPAQNWECLDELRISILKSKKAKKLKSKNLIMNYMIWLNKILSKKRDTPRIVYTIQPNFPLDVSLT